MLRECLQLQRTEKPTQNGLNNKGNLLHPITGNAEWGMPQSWSIHQPNNVTKHPVILCLSALYPQSQLHLKTSSRAVVEWLPVVNKVV